MSSRTKSNLFDLYPAGTKLYRKTLKSRFGVRGYKEHFDVKPIYKKRSR